LTLIAHFQDLSKVNTLVLVGVLDLTKTRTTLDKKLFLSRYECSFQEFLWTVLPDTKTKIKIKMLLIFLAAST
jgi:hypothetical protein